MEVFAKKTLKYMILMAMENLHIQMEIYMKDIIVKIRKIALKNRKELSDKFFNNNGKMILKLNNEIFKV